MSSEIQVGKTVILALMATVRSAERLTSRLTSTKKERVTVHLIPLHAIAWTRSIYVNNDGWPRFTHQARALSVPMKLVHPNVIEHLLQRSVLNSVATFSVDSIDGMEMA